jgi:hypothetical protein
MPYDPYDRGDNPWRGDLDSLDMPKARPKAKPGAGRMPLQPAMPGIPLPPIRPPELAGVPLPPVRPPGMGGPPMPPPRPPMGSAEELKGDREFGSTPGPTAGMLAPGAPPGGPPPGAMAGGPPPPGQPPGGMEALMKLLAGMGGGMRGIG